MKRTRLVTSLIACIISVSLHAQSAQARPIQSKESRIWDEKKLTVAAQKPFISDAGFLVFPYTVTNNTDSDLPLDFTVPVYEKRDADRIYFLLRTTNSLQEIDMKQGDIAVSPKLIPSRLPIQLTVVVGSAKYKDSILFESYAAKLSRALSEQTGNVRQIVILIPSLHAKLNLPVEGTR